MNCLNIRSVHPQHIRTAACCSPGSYRCSAASGSSIGSVLAAGTAAAQDAQQAALCTELRAAGAVINVRTQHTSDMGLGLVWGESNNRISLSGLPDRTAWLLGEHALVRQLRVPSAACNARCSRHRYLQCMPIPRRWQASRPRTCCWIVRTLRLRRQLQMYTIPCWMPAASQRGSSHSLAA
jgi:hypothetical protein